MVWKEGYNHIKTIEKSLITFLTVWLENRARTSYNRVGRLLHIICDNYLTLAQLYFSIYVGMKMEHSMYLIQMGGLHLIMHNMQVTLRQYLY